MNRIIEPRSYCYGEYCKAITDLCGKYPFIIKSVIGKSVGRKNLYALGIGNVKNCVLYAAAFHGAESITTVLLLQFIEDLCKALVKGVPFCGIDARRAVYSKGLIALPRVNPDGCDISLLGEAGVPQGWRQSIGDMCKGDYTHWQANLNGVDINHNFPALWQKVKLREQALGIMRPGPTRFGGRYAQSEPETKAVIKLCHRTSPALAVAFHSQGEVIYRGFNGLYIKNELKIGEVFSAACGYPLDTAAGIAEGGGFKDWFLQEFLRPAYTFEVGFGQNPLPPEDILHIYPRLAESMMLGLIM